MFAISIERVSGSGSLPRRFSDAVELSGVVFPRRVTGGVYIGSGGLLVGVQASGGECASVLPRLVGVQASGVECASVLVMV